MLIFYDPITIIIIKRNHIIHTKLRMAHFMINFVHTFGIVALIE